MELLAWLLLSLLITTVNLIFFRLGWISRGIHDDQIKEQVQK